MLGVVHAAAEALDGVAGEDGDGRARDHLSRVYPLVDEVDRRRSGRRARGQHVLERMRAGEVGERSRMHVDDAPREAVEERGA